ncbi:hypothetical protein [Salipaludibacillus aurantiacus]|uniref:Uncharacterized protein n=1 Tax=Salipaludibacillus aurantiacus TaxID=1601833 RepID=A0A1H9UUM8_9BACI|nr:hypothetical protein [Salipaludibacillus aurantiacus]SES13068.1 hypothetical protein SAMN05518684_108185 [Salipaludibacillus aurantiacus]
MRFEEDVTYFRSKIGRNKEKKMENIAEYIEEKKGIKLKTDLPPDSFLENLSHHLNEEDVNEIYDILDQVYSDGTPYWIYKINAHCAAGELMKILHHELENRQEDIGNTLQFHNFRNLEYDRETESISFKISYIIFKELVALGGQKSRGNEEKKGDIQSVIIDLNTKLLLIEQGDRRITQGLIELLNSKMLMKMAVDSVDIKNEFLISHNKPEVSIDSFTALILYYLDKGIVENGYKITDYIEVRFDKANVDGVRRIGLAGTNLLSTTEVADHVIKQHKITAVKFELEKDFPNGNKLTSSVSMNFSSILKIVLKETYPNGYQFEITKHLYDSILKTLIQGIPSEYDINSRLGNMLTAVEKKQDSYRNAYLERTLEEVKDEVLKAIEAGKTGKDIENIFAKYLK